MGTHLAHFMTTANSQLGQTSSMSIFSSNRLNQRPVAESVQVYQHPRAKSVQVCARVIDGVMYTTCVIEDHDWTHALTPLSKPTHLISPQICFLHGDGHIHTEQMPMACLDLEVLMTCSFHRNQLSQWRANASCQRKEGQSYKCRLHSTVQCSHLSQLISNNSN